MLLLTFLCRFWLLPCSVLVWLSDDASVVVEELYGNTFDFMSHDLVKTRGAGSAGSERCSTRQCG